MNEKFFLKKWPNNVFNHDKYVIEKWPNYVPVCKYRYVA